MLSRFIAIILLLVTVGQAKAQTQAPTPLTLEQAVSSFDGSPRLLKARSATEEAGWKRAEVFSQFLPTVSASAQRLLDKKYMLTDVPGIPNPIPQILPTTIYTLGAQWVFFDGFANVDRYQAARDLEQASRKELSWTEFQGRRDVILAFYKALGAQILKEVAEQNLKALHEHLNDTRLFRKAGISTKFDVLQVEVQASSAKSEVLNAQDSASIVALRLGELIGQDLRSRQVEGRLPVVDESVIASLSPQTGDRADLQALEERLSGLDELSQAAGKHWIPKVSLNGQFQHYDNRGDDFTGDQFRDAYTVGIQLTWAYDGIIGPVARAGVADEQKYQAMKSLEMTRLKATNDVEFWRRRYLYSVSVYKDRQDDIERATERVRLAREGRRAGTRTNTELLDAETELFRARAQSVNAQVGAVEALINLELATGRELYKFH